MSGSGAFEDRVDDDLIDQRLLCGHGRVAARAGVYAYYGLEPRELVYGDPDRVSIPLKMSAGAAAEPRVRVGDAVREGDLIAAIPDGKLGANVHASIAGTVTEISDRIVIEKGGADA